MKRNGAFFIQSDCDHEQIAPSHRWGRAHHPRTPGLWLWLCAADLQKFDSVIDWSAWNGAYLFWCTNFSKVRKRGCDHRTRRTSYRRTVDYHKSGRKRSQIKSQSGKKIRPKRRCNSGGGLQENDIWAKRRRRSSEDETWDEDHSTATQAMEVHIEGIGEEDIILHRRSFVWVIIRVIDDVLWVECWILKFWVLWVFGFYGCAALNPEFSAQLAARVRVIGLLTYVAYCGLGRRCSYVRVSQKH